MLIRRLVFIILLASLTSLLAYADENTSPLAKEQLPKMLAALEFNKVGSAKFSVLFWDIYDSHLFTKSGRYQEQSDQDVIFKIEYLRDISAGELIKRTVEQWQHLNYQESDFKEFIPRLKRIWPDISAGDSLTLYRNSESTEFYFNNTNIGVIDSDQFYKLFLAIWLSPDTSEPELRQSLIGTGNNY